MRHIVSTDPSSTEDYTLSLHDALPISRRRRRPRARQGARGAVADGGGDAGGAAAVHRDGLVSGGGRALIVAAILSGSPAASLSAQCPDGSAPPCARLRAPLDTTRYVILPLPHREGTQPSLLDGADCAEDRKSVV